MVDVSHAYPSLSKSMQHGFENPSPEFPEVPSSWLPPLICTASSGFKVEILGANSGVVAVPAFRKKEILPLPIPKKQSKSPERGWYRG